jgi:hypothetical protein
MSTCVFVRHQKIEADHLATNLVNDLLSPLLAKVDVELCIIGLEAQDLEVIDLDDLVAFRGNNRLCLLVDELDVVFPLCNRHDDETVRDSLQGDEQMVR